MAPPLRVFFALWPDAAARERIAAAARVVVERAGGRAPRSKNHHLTLAFVGAVAPDRVAALRRVGESAAGVVAPFALTLDRLGSFHHTGIAWLGTGNAPPELERLVHALRVGLATEGFVVEQRAYRTHLTLARRCGALAAAASPPIAWRVENITLTVSELRPEGSSYRELAAWSLQGR